ncbi:MAG: TatD family hydrolase [Gammaproteobacteria bacterium]|jgi:TatD DNase family protein
MLIDSHCHLDRLDLTKYAGQLDGVIDAARAVGVEHILNVCVNLQDFPRVLEIAEAYDDVSCTVGLQPSEHQNHEPSVDDLVELSQHPKVIAIGEAGLEYFHCSGDLAWQHERFRRHIRAARQVKKPLVIHSRESSEDVYRILREERAAEVGGVLHCFTDSYEYAQKFVDLGFYIGITGIVTFKKAVQVQETAQKIPLTRLLIETDAPYLTPVPYRGKPNEPAYVRYVAEAIAELREISYAEVAEQTTANFWDLFSD